jgi:hypothetical protein
MLVIVRNDSRVHQAELKKKEERRRKSEQHFPVLERFDLFTRSILSSFRSRLSSCHVQ